MAGVDDRPSCRSPPDRVHRERSWTNLRPHRRSPGSQPDHGTSGRTRHGSARSCSMRTRSSRSPCRSAAITASADRAPSSARTISSSSADTNAPSFSGEPPQHDSDLLELRLHVRLRAKCRFGSMFSREMMGRAPQRHKEAEPSRPRRCRKADLGERRRVRQRGWTRCAEVTPSRRSVPARHARSTSSSGRRSRRSARWIVCVRPGVLPASGRPSASIPYFFSSSTDRSVDEASASGRDRRPCRGFCLA